MFIFNYSGNQSVKNTLVIKDNQTNETIYSETNTTFLLKHTLPANSLINGNTYNAQIFSIDVNETTSAPSNKIVFKCYTSPSWGFLNLTENQIIRNSSYQLRLTYLQAEGELLNSYQVFLYNSGQTLVHQSGIFYASDILLEYTISNLSDNNQYYIRAIGKTVNGMDLDTGFIKVSVEYQAPILYSLVQLENLPHDGTIKISYNAIVVTGKTNIGEPVYIDNTKVDLTAKDRYVYFDEGFELQGDGIFQIVGQDFNDYSAIFEWSNGTDKLEVKYMRGTFASQSEEKAYFMLHVYNGLIYYMIYSNYIPIPSPTDQVHVWMKRVNNIYQLQCEILNK